MYTAVKPTLKCKLYGSAINLPDTVMVYTKYRKMDMISSKINVHVYKHKQCSTFFQGNILYITERNIASQNNTIVCIPRLLLT